MTDTVLDPVCGMRVDPSRAAGQFEYRGTTYYFCNPVCRERFQADPERYLQAAHAAVPSMPGDAEREYTCPMHPEVRQRGPGACPKCGMALEPVDVDVTDDVENAELADMSHRFWWSVGLTAPILAFMVAETLPGEIAASLVASPAINWIELALATPVVLWGGWPFFVRGWSSIVTRQLNMFTLIALGIGAAYGYSVVATLTPDLFPHSFRMMGKVAVYFEPAAVITVLVLLGQVLELKARAQTSGALRRLLGLTPKTARRVALDGLEMDIPLEDVHVGDHLRVRPGERVPVDGVVVDGTTSIDESMITGEPMPMAKNPGMPVTGGTINGTGSVVMEARRVGRDTLLAQIVRMVSEAQRSRAPIQRLADVVSAWFVPVVIAVAVATFVAWSAVGPEPRLAHALVNAIAVLIIACPCALGLATPMSIMVGTGRGAESGVLIRDAEALEVFEKVTTLVVDKTGTLTEGRPALVTVQPVGNVDEATLLKFAAGLERSSEHPLAAAVVAGASDRGLTLPRASDFASVTGKGVSGTIEGRRVVVGSRAFLGDQGLDTTMLAERAEALRREGQTVLHVAIGGQTAGLIGVADRIKPTTVEAIRALQQDGLQIVMLTGDNKTTADAVARAVGVSRIEAEVLPDQKAAAVKRLQRHGERVAMAGDGVNDAPALAQADVGIAMGTGTDVAMESAGMTLVKGDLRGIVRARRLSRLTMANIRQNLFFAFIYNVIGVPIAAGLLYPFFGLLLSPMIASAAMTFSSVSVIANALRLRKAAL